MTQQEVRKTIEDIKGFHDNFLSFMDKEYKGADDVIKGIAVEISDILYEKQSIYTAALIEAKDDNIIILA